MKKLLMFVMCSIMAVSYARADDTEQLRAACQSSDKTVWVELNKVCIPRYPCRSDNQEIRKNYCRRVFADIQVPTEEKGRILAEAYIKNVLHTTGTVFKKGLLNNGDSVAGFYGQDYIDYQLANGGYVEFEFDDLVDMTITNGGIDHGLENEINIKTYRKNYAIKGAFKAFGYDDVRSDVSSEQCERIVDLANEVYHRDGFITKNVFSGFLENVSTDGRCEIDFEK